MFLNKMSDIVPPTAILDADIVQEWRVIGIVHCAEGIRK